ncbi:thioesterase II family protein [Peterkaempfera sp. SMS 1(5)a]|uniref:thioesterase II family protein n=1 Tax=Peterkaempfera podocarpi TaxID=3232308 RepID=UPI003671AB10
MSSGRTPWILGPVDERAGGERLFCFPHAGAGASAYSSWRPHLPDSVALFPVQLPGRETRSGDPVPDTLDELSEQVATALLPLLRPPYVLFGHSFGGLLVYALARHLHERGHPLPQRLIISGARPPHLAATTSYHLLPHGELLDFLRATNGIPASLLRHEEFVLRLLQVLRTDLRLAAEYVPATAEPLPCDIRILTSTDDPVVPAGLMQGWRDYTAGEFGTHRAAGDHHAVHDVTGELFTALVRSGLDLG